MVGELNFLITQTIRTLVLCKSDFKSSSVAQIPAFDSVKAK